MKLIIFCALFALASAGGNFYAELAAQGVDPNAAAAADQAPAIIQSTRNEDGIGNYQFAYQAAGGTGQQGHQESGDIYGRKQGSYSLGVIDGRERVVDYVADELGYRASIRTNEPGTAPLNPADVTIQAPDTTGIAGITQEQTVRQLNALATAPPDLSALGYAGGLGIRGAGLGLGAAGLGGVGLRGVGLGGAGLGGVGLRGVGLGGAGLGGVGLAGYRGAAIGLGGAGVGGLGLAGYRGAAIGLGGLNAGAYGLAGRIAAPIGGLAAPIGGLAAPIGGLAGIRYGGVRAAGVGLAPAGIIGGVAPLAGAYGGLGVNNLAVGGLGLGNVGYGGAYRGAYGAGLGLGGLGYGAGAVGIGRPVAYGGVISHSAPAPIAGIGGIGLGVKGYKSK